MVNLSTIDKNVYKSLGFKNKSIGQTMIKEVLQTKVTNFKTIPALVQHLKPRIRNLINLGFDINDKKLNKQLKSIKNISKKIEKLDINNKDVEKIFVKWEEESNNKIRYVTGKIKVKEIYYAREDKTYIYYQEYDGSNTYRGSKESVIEQFKKDLFDKHNFMEASPEKEHIVQEIIITSIVEKESTTVSKEDNAMKNATPLMYNCISEYREFLQNTGTCVVDNFIGMYGPKLDKYISYFLESSESNTQIDDYTKYFLESDTTVNLYIPGRLKLTRDKFIDLCKEYYKNKNQCWSLEHGITPQCVNSICEKYDITHYCLDVHKSVIIKSLSKNQNHKALIYFSVNNHMYLILDSEMRKSLVETVKEKENFNTSLLSDEVEEKTNIYDDYDIIENPTTFFTETKNTIYMFSRLGTSSINDVFQSLIVDHGVPSNIRCKKTKIEGFKYKKNNIIYMFVCDNNALHNITYKEVKVLCEKNDLPFKNQTFMQVVKQLRSKYFDEITGRIKFTKEFKEMVLEKSEKKCAGCECCLESKKYEIDHIKPLASGGTNQIDNLQALCKACHRDKTANENEQGLYVKFSDTESCFNNTVQEIMNSALSHAYAFVEPIREPTKGKKLFTIDINKCRRNILLNHKHDYCIFNVMDEPEVFEEKTKIIEGLYYIETDSYFPLRGNGWYYHSLVQYCLDNKIITKNNIKYVIYSSSTVKHDYYNGFINYCNKHILNYDQIQEYYNTRTDENINFEGAPQEDETCINLNDDGEYEKIYVVKNKCILSDYKKSCINSMIGGFKPNTQKKVNWRSVHVTESKIEALQFSIQYEGSYIDTFVSNNKLFFHVFAPSKTTNIETERPLYDQIVQQEAMELHRLKTLVESKGGVVTDINTDAITCTFPNDKFPFDLIDEKNLDYYWDELKTVPKYKLEPNAKRVKYPKLVHYMRFDNYTLHTEPWDITPDVPDNNFEPLINKILDSNESWLINGPPGAGKTTLINKIKEYLTNNNKVYKCLAPTNLAALLIDGTTVHKFACKLKKLTKFMETQLDYIFVDEVSMLHSNFYKILMIIKQLKNCNIIVSGDFNQLDVIGDLHKYDYKNSSILKELCDHNNINLQTCRRSNDKLFNLIQFDNINNLKPDDFKSDLKIDNDINICWTNNTRKKINSKYMDAAYKKAKTSNYITLKKLEYDDNSQDVILVNKTPLIAKVNNGNLKLINNERYIIKKVDKNTKEIVVENSREVPKKDKNGNEIKDKDGNIVMDKIIKTLKIKADEFQKLFRIGYAFTTHSAQGMSIDKPYTIHEFNRMDKKLKYVALSRATKYENINIIM
jgi:5-methylcytosine-specific restriction enzyme A